MFKDFIKICSSIILPSSLFVSIFKYLKVSEIKVDVSLMSDSLDQKSLDKDQVDLKPK